MEELTQPRDPEGINADRRQMLRTIFEETLQVIDPRKALTQSVSWRQGVLHIADLSYRLADVDRVLVISIGKAAVPCAEVILGALAGSETPVEAIVVGPGEISNFPCAIQRWQGSHPLPDASSRDAARYVLHTLKSCSARDLILFLISGGASAMLELPLDPALTIEETAAFYLALVNSVLNIADMNTLRKHLSAVKGGRLAEAATDATKCTLLISDVREGREDVIGSGPSLPDLSTREDCFEIMRRPELKDKVPDRVRAFLESAELPETPKAGAPCFRRARSRVLLSTETMLLAAASALQRRGFHVVINNTCDDCEYRAAADYLLARLRELSAEYPRVALVSGGEVLVGVGANAGIGGRNQQFALYCATKLHTVPAHTTVLSAGSDGIDGNSPAAGAVLNSTTMNAAEHQSREALERFDSYPLLRQLGATIVTGPTGNNVRDLRILIAER